MLIASSSASESFGVAMFFVSYVLLTSVVLINVVVAVLIEKFTVDYDEEEAKELATELEKLRLIAQGEKAKSPKREDEMRSSMSVEELGSALATSSVPGEDDDDEAVAAQAAPTKTSAANGSSWDGLLDKVNGKGSKNVKGDKGVAHLLQRLLQEQASMTREQEAIRSEQRAAVAMMSSMTREQEAMRSEQRAAVAMMSETLSLLREMREALRSGDPGQAATVVAKSEEAPSWGGFFSTPPSSTRAMQPRSAARSALRHADTAPGTLESDPCSV